MGQSMDDNELLLADISILIQDVLRARTDMNTGVGLSFGTLRRCALPKNRNPADINTYVELPHGTTFQSMEDEAKG